MYVPSGVLDEWFAWVSVTSTPSTSIVPPLLIECAPPSSATPWAVSHPRSSTCATTGTAEALVDRDRVAEMVAVAVRQEDQVAALGLSLVLGVFGLPVRNGST